MSATTRTISARRFRWHHQSAGWRDGRRGLPLLASGAPLPHHLLRVSSEYAGRIDRLWLQLLEATESDRKKRAELLPELARAVQRRELAARALDAHLATSPSNDRKFGEESMPIELVTARRQRTWSTTLQRLEADWKKRRNYVVQLEQQRSGIEESLRVMLEMSQSRARDLYSSHDLARAHYLRGASHSHHDPRALAQISDRFALPRSAWVSLDGLDDFLRAAGTEQEQEKE